MIIYMLVVLIAVCCCMVCHMGAVQFCIENLYALQSHVARVSGGVSQAATDSPHRGDSDSTLTSTQTTTISLDTSVSNLNLSKDASLV